MIINFIFSSRLFKIQTGSLDHELPQNDAKVFNQAVKWFFRPA